MIIDGPQGIGVTYGRLTIALVAALGTVALLACGGAHAWASKPRCPDVHATLTGTQGADALRATKGADVILAKGGADRIIGADGRDLVCAGAGRDVVVTRLGHL